MADAIVMGPLFDIAECFVGLVYLFELALSGRVFVPVWVKLESELAERPADVLRSGLSVHPQHLVIVAFCRCHEGKDSQLFVAIVQCTDWLNGSQMVVVTFREAESDHNREKLAGHIPAPLPSGAAPFDKLSAGSWNPVGLLSTACYSGSKMHKSR
ncbi:MAG: hypothetical protein HW397_602, partial [Dehalococcoidia bacterium]|nr:hypothetical protein [Dehalococcoidia bacterium]